MRHRSCLIWQVQQERAKLKVREERAFAGLFSRAQKEGPLFSKDEIERCVHACTSLSLTRMHACMRRPIFSKDEIERCAEP